MHKNQSLLCKVHRSDRYILPYLSNTLIDGTNKMYYYAYTHGGDAV